MYKIIDFKTKQEVKPDNLVFTGEQSPWEVVMDLDKIKHKINLDYFKTATPCLAKYLSLMPIKQHAHFVSLREVATPLIRSKTIGKRLGLELYFKIEGKNPTGSFKDRGSAVDISVAKEFNAKGIVVASTGNMAASCSCYAAAAKIPCFVFVPEGVPASKLAQVISYGGYIVQVKGSYNDAAQLAQTVAEEMGFYLAGDYAFRVEGQKTAAFEIVDQLLLQPPEAVFVPIGCGTNMTAYAKGFKEYQQLGIIEELPKLFGVQAAGSAAVVNSFNKKSHEIETLESCETIATAIAVPNPIDGTKALDAIYSTDGQALAVTDTEILKAQYLLSTEEGLFVESASAATVAALMKAVEQGDFTAKKVVCVLTGEGLKDPSVILKAAIKPPTIYPEAKEFSALYDSKFFDNQTMIFIDKDEIIFTQEPSVAEVKTQLIRLVNSEYDAEHLEKIQHIISSFLRKGKQISVADLQDIIQDARESLSHKTKESFSVVDFEVETGKDRIPQAKVVVKIDDQQHQAEASGVGPVDALINALRTACEGKIDFKLMDYHVETRSHGVNAVVYVELKLVKDHFKSLGRATSPDIIQASIEAFEEAYNGFM